MKKIYLRYMRLKRRVSRKFSSTFAGFVNSTFLYAEAAAHTFFFEGDNCDES
jgi:hypothetical protein